MAVVSQYQPITSWPPRKVVVATLTVLIVCAAFWLAYRFHYAVFMLLAAMMLRVAIKPAVEWLRTRGLRANLSVLLVFSGLGTVLIGLSTLIAPLFVEQIGSLVNKLPQYYIDLQTTLTRSPNSLFQQVGAALPSDWTTLLPQLNLAALRENATIATVAPATSFLASLSYGTFLLVATLMMTVYWTLDAERITRALLMRAPQAKRESWRELIAELEGKVGSYFRGQLILCGFIFVLSTIAFLIIGLPYAFVLGLLAGLLEVLPMIGPVLGMVPAMLVALATEPQQAIWVIVAATLIQQIENNLLVPRVMDKSVGINPIVSILAIAAFSLLFGLVGALLAIPVAAILQILVGRVLFSTSEDIEEITTQQTALAPYRNKLSLLRLEVRELTDDVRKQVRAEIHTNDSLSETTQKPEEIIEDQIEIIARELDDLLGQTELTQQSPKSESTTIHSLARAGI
jgi:predicted PurR-regulated permease PerM